MAIFPQAEPPPGADRGDRVRRLFSDIAHRYDLLNHLLSLNVDRRWRRQAVARLGWESRPRGRFLDACAGTYDLGLELARQPGFRGRVVAADFAFPMLVEGRGKLLRSMMPVCGDSLRLPFPDACFDGALVGFGVRNLADIGVGLRELARVLRSGSRLVILDFTDPPNPLLRRLYHFYFHRVLPVAGRIVSGHPWAYTYLPESVKEFPGPEGLAALLGESGFADVEWSLLSGGIAAVHLAVRA